MMDEGMKDFRTFMKQWAPGESVVAIFAYSIAQMIVEVLKNCGEDLPAKTS